MITEKLEEFYKKLKDFAEAEIAEGKLSRDKQAVNIVIDEINEQSNRSTIDFSESLKILNAQKEAIKLPEKQLMLIEQLEQPYLLKEWTNKYMEAIEESEKKDILLSISGTGFANVRMVLSSLKKKANIQILNEEQKDFTLSFYVTLTSADLIEIKDKIKEFKNVVNIDAVHFLPDFRERTFEENKRLIKENIQLHDRNLVLQAAELGYCSTNALYNPMDGIRFIEKSLQKFYNGTRNIYENKQHPANANTNVVYYLYVDESDNKINPFSDIKNKSIENIVNKTKKHTP